MVNIDLTKKEFKQLISMVEFATAKTMGITRSISDEHMGVLIKIEQAQRRINYNEGLVSYFIRHLTSERE